MNWRTIYIESDQHIKLENNSLILERNEEKLKVFLDDIGVIIVDNYKTNISIPTLIEISKRNISFILNSKNHDPISLLLPLSGHYKPLQNFQKQLELSINQKNNLRNQLIKKKIKNQANLMEDLGVEDIYLKKMINYENNVVKGDVRNCEGSSARLFFLCVYGSKFIRFTDDSINNSLNYGFKIIASRISSILVKHGLNPVLGIFHKGQENYFNLAYDFIEPFRPAVDFIVSKNNDLLIDDKLSLLVRTRLVKVLDMKVMIDAKTTTIRNAIEIVVKSFVSFLNKTTEKLILPDIYPKYGEEKGDEEIEGNF